MTCFVAAPDCAETPAESSVDVVVEVCGAPSVVPEGIAYLRPGGLYLLVGLVHPDSVVPVSMEAVIRKCLTIKGLLNGEKKLWFQNMRNSFGVACVQCEHSFSQQQVPFDCCVCACASSVDPASARLEAAQSSVGNVWEGSLSMQGR